MTFTEIYDAWATYEAYANDVQHCETLANEITALIKDDIRHIQGLFNDDFPCEVEEFMGCLNNGLFDTEFTKYAQDEIDDMLWELSDYTNMTDGWDFEDDDEIEKALKEGEELRARIYKFFAENYDHPTIEDAEAADEDK